MAYNKEISLFMKVFLQKAIDNCVIIVYSIVKERTLVYVYIGEMPEIFRSKSERDGSLSLLGDNKLP